MTELCAKFYVRSYFFNFLSTFSNHFYNIGQQMMIILFVCFVALRPKSTAMVMAGRSVHLTTLFPGQA